MALNRSIGLLSATSIGIGTIIGEGIFVVTGIAASLAGPAIVISVMIAGAIAVFNAFSFSELSTELLPNHVVFPWYEKSERKLGPESQHFDGFRDSSHSQQQSSSSHVCFFLVHGAVHVVESLYHYVFQLLVHFF